MDEITYTHKGWFGLCPVYIAEPYSDEPAFEPRYPGTDWLLSCELKSSSWWFRVTGELEDPIVVEYER